MSCQEYQLDSNWQEFSSMHDSPFMPAHFTIRTCTHRTPVPGAALVPGLRQPAAVAAAHDGHGDAGGGGGYAAAPVPAPLGQGLAARGAEAGPAQGAGDAVRLHHPVEGGAEAAGGRLALLGTGRPGAQPEQVAGRSPPPFARAETSSGATRGKTQNQQQQQQQLLLRGAESVEGGGRSPEQRQQPSWV